MSHSLNNILVVSEEYLEPRQDCILQPGEVLLKCNGQDIVKKNGMNKASKHRILTIFPCQFLLANNMNDCKIGMLHNLSSSTPEYHLVTEDGILVFPGRFEYPSTKFLSILCHPGSGSNSSCSTTTSNATSGGGSNKAKNASCVLTDMFDRILIFDKPILEPRPLTASVATVEEDIMGLDIMTQGSMVTATASTMNKNTASQLESTDNHNIGTQQSYSSSYSIGTGIAPITTTTANYCKHFGMSSLADPLKTNHTQGAITQLKVISNRATTTASTYKIKRNIIRDDESIESAAPDDNGDASYPKITTATTTTSSFRKTNRRVSINKAISYKEDDSDIEEVDQNSEEDNSDDDNNKELIDVKSSNNNKKKNINPSNKIKKATKPKSENIKNKKINNNNNIKNESDSDNNGRDSDSDFEIPKNKKRNSISLLQTKKSTAIATLLQNYNEKKTRKSTITTTTKNNTNNNTIVDSDIEIIQDIKKTQGMKQNNKSSRVKKKKLKTESSSNVITIDDD